MSQFTFGSAYDFLDRGRDWVVDQVESFTDLDFFGEGDPNAYSGRSNNSTGRANDMELTAVDRTNPVNINGMMQGELYGVPVKYIVGGLGAVLALVVLKKVL